jgi:hypothetical protein
MRYRVNFYPERVSRESVVRQRMLRGTLLGLVIGTELLLAGLLIVSGFEIQDRAAGMRKSLARLTERAGSLPPNPPLGPARRLIHDRLERVDFAPVVEAVSRSIPEEIILVEIQAGTGEKPGALDGMNLEGRVVGRERDLDPILQFMENLRAEERIQGVFPIIDLDVAGGGQDRFRIVCRRAAAGGDS